LTVAIAIVHITRRPPHDTNEGAAPVEFAYTPEQLELRARARALADEIMVHEQACEERNGLPPEVHADVSERVRHHGLNAINMPAEWGGQGLSVLDQVIVQEQLGRLTNALWDMVWRPANALRACDEEQRERYLIPGIRGERRDCVAVTERDAGSDPSAIATTAERTAGGGFRLNGEKWFVTVGDAADYMIVLANVLPERAPTLFLVDKDVRGVRVLRTPRYMHTFVYEHPEFGFEDVELGGGAVLGEIGQGYELTRDWFVEERLMIAARAIGAAERALRAAADWAAERRQFGQRLLDFQLIQAMVADSVVDIATNRALVHQVAWEADRGLDRKTLHAKAAVVKLAASEAGGRVVDRALQIFGGRGYMRENPCERLYRDLRVDRIWEGTSEIQRLIVGNEAGKRGLDGVLSFGDARVTAPAGAAA
jgi:acyl-CoA dehydrogenase